MTSAAAAVAPEPREVAVAPGVRLTTEQAHELIRCALDFQYFCKYWKFVSRETTKVHSFAELWPGQKLFADAMRDHPWIFALKAGKLGFTELECAFDYWVLRFRQANVRVHVFSMNLPSAKLLRSYVKFGHDHLPEWMKLPIIDEPGGDTTQQLVLSGGRDDKRTLVCFPSTQNVSIDQSANHTHLDELARMPFPEATWSVVESTIADVPDATCHIVTRGRGPANFSAALWSKALGGRSRLHALFVPWHRRPRRDEHWREEQRAENKSESLFLQFAPETWEEAIQGSGADTLINIDWVEAAFARERRGTGGLVAIGADIARYGADHCGVTIVEDMDVVGLEEWAKLSLMQTVGRLVAIIKSYPGCVIAVDDTGMGGGVVDRLLELRLDCTVVAVNFGARASDDDRFYNLLSEMWWRVREMLDPDARSPLSLPGHHSLRERLQMQLTGAQYDIVDSRGRIRVYKAGREKPGPNEDPLESPDLADSLALALEAYIRAVAVRRRPTARRYHGASVFTR